MRDGVGANPESRFLAGRNQTGFRINFLSPDKAGEEKIFRNDKLN
jgi:hypothetical protein